MAYAEPTTRARKPARRSNGDGARVRQEVHAPEYDVDMAETRPSEGGDWGGDWRRAGLIGSAVALGLAVGAGVAMLFAPQSGAGTRADLARATRRLGWRTHDAWDDLRDELAWASRRSGRHVGRGVRRGGWLAEDAWASGRRRLGR